MPNPTRPEKLPKWALDEAHRLDYEVTEKHMFTEVCKALIAAFERGQAQRILEYEQQGLEMFQKIREQRERAEAAEARVAELECALEPFAVVGRGFEDGLGLDRDGVWLWKRSSTVREEPGITVAHVKRAATLLNRNATKGGG